MTKKLSTQIMDNGELVNIELDDVFLNFYKRETGHSRITKRGVTRFLQNLFDSYRRRLTDSYYQQSNLPVPFALQE